MANHLIVGDSHNKFRIVEQILELEKDNYDKVILLGDTFDSYYDTPDMAKETAIWLKQKIYDPKFTILVGNHCSAYVWHHNPNMYCSGFSHEKVRAIYSVLTKEEMLKLKLFYSLDNILFTHASLGRKFLDYMIKKGYSDEFEYSLPNIVAKMEEWGEKAYQLLSVNQMHPIYEAGWSRGGRAECAGATWADFGEFEAIRGVVSIHGHTPVYPDHLAVKLFNPKSGVSTPSRPEKESRNLDHLYSYGFGLNLDSHLESYAIYDDVSKIIQVYALSFNISHKEDELGTKGRKIIKSALIWSKNLSIVK